MSFKFDSQVEIHNRTRVASVPGESEVAMRFPDDEMWAERSRKCKLVQKSLGRGYTEMETDFGDIDLKIYERVKLNGSPALTPLEATKFINMASLVQVTDVTLLGEGAEVQAKVCGGTVEHTLKRTPTIDEVHKLNHAARQLNNGRGQTEFRIYLEPGAKLYDACGGTSEDYVNGIIPAIHKDAVVRQVIQEVEHSLEAGPDELGF